MRVHSLVLALALGGPLVSCGPGEPTEVEGPIPRRVLLISLDTLRADHTGFGGYSKPTTPFLDTLAAEAVVFDNHFANSNCTLPSHATMLTGLHYPSHGVRPVGEDEPIRKLPVAAVSLAQRFQENGFQTAGFTSHGAWLNAEYGFDRGFDHFESGWVEADEIIEGYLNWVDEEKPKQSFVFLHFFDIHSDSAEEGPCLPYNSTPALVEEFAGERPEGFTGCSQKWQRRDGKESCASKYLKDVSIKLEPLPDEHREYLVGLYDAGIRKLDDQLRYLFEELEERGQLRNALVVVTSDHGESFGEHGTMLHDTHHDEVARVPLIVRLPVGAGVAPRRIQAITQSTDLAPTLLDLCGLEPIGQLPSLAPAIMLGEEPADGLVLFHSHIVIGRDEGGEYKMVRVGGGKSPVFFDRDVDPEERYNLFEQGSFKEDNRQRLEAISQAMDRLNAEGQKLLSSLEALEGGQGGSLSPERIAELKALGYLGGSGDGTDED
jgi:arylsulfatase A-like enzyme